MLFRSLAVAVAGVPSDGVAAGVAGAAPCHNLTHLAQCLTMAVERVHGDSTGDLYWYPQGYFHTKVRKADRVSCEAPPYVVEISSDAG